MHKLGEQVRRGVESADTWAAVQSRVQMELGDQAPYIPKLSQSQAREEFRLLVLCFWPTVPPEEPTYKTAELNAHSRDRGANTEGRRVKNGGLSPYCQAEYGRHRRRA